MLDKQVEEFFKGLEVGVLSTADIGGNVSGAVVYFATDDDCNVYILTLNSSRKVVNINENNKVALTTCIHDFAQCGTLWGKATIDDTGDYPDWILKRILRRRKYGDKESLPPVTKMEDKHYVLITIVPEGGVFRNYMTPWHE